MIRLQRWTREITPHAHSNALSMAVNRLLIAVWYFKLTLLLPSTHSVSAVRDGYHGVCFSILHLSFTLNIQGVRSGFSPRWVRVGLIEPTLALAWYSICTQIDDRSVLPVSWVKYSANTLLQYIGVNRWSLLSESTHAYQPPFHACTCSRYR